MFNYPLLYLEHLSRRDLEVLAETAGGKPADARARLVEQPAAIDALLGSPLLFERLFVSGGSLEPGVSPFLVFGVLVMRSAADLERASFVPEWSAPHKRLPVFDHTGLRDFLGDGGRRFFLIELLSSFTRVAGGVWWERTARGFRRHRYSELDLIQLTEFTRRAPASIRPALWRRLADVALFLAGVFPDHTAEHPDRPERLMLLARSAGLQGVEPALVVAGNESVLRFHEGLAQRWYRRALEEVPEKERGPLGYLGDVADRIPHARRVLNYISDRHLFRLEQGWLTGPGRG